MNGIAVPKEVVQSIRALASGDPARREDAYAQLLQATEPQVGWSGPVWTDLIPLLEHEDNHVRSIAGQVLCNLAKSAEPDSVIGDIDKLFAVTRDKRFVTARHVLKSLWKAGLGTQEVRDAVVDRFVQRFETAEGEKNSTLIRYDILCAMRSLFDATDDNRVKSEAIDLIAIEQDDQYRRKYEGVWRDV